MEAIWKQLDDKNSFLLPEVHQNLPQGIIDSLNIKQSDEHDSAKKFDAIHSVQIDKAEHRVQEICLSSSQSRLFIPV